MGGTGRGIAAMVLACLIWGVAPVIYRAMGSLPATTILAHRTLWSFVFFGAVLLVQGRAGELGALMASRRGLGLVVAAAALIGFNWFLFIWAIVGGRALEASLGYYVFPLIALLFGRFAFGERLDRASLVAVALAATAVAVLTWGLGSAPWIALLLAGSFGLYGVIKKVLAAGPVVSVTAEVLLIAPLSLGWLLTHPAGGFGSDLRLTLLLVLAGPLTAGPLVLFSYASRRIGFGTVGVLQYINPSIQFLIAVLVFGEPLTRWHAVALPLIWAALAIYSAAAIARDRAARVAAGTAGRAVV
jgi:chloramphenicol-sensitive protein RarD